MREIKKQVNYVNSNEDPVVEIDFNQMHEHSFFDPGTQC